MNNSFPSFSGAVRPAVFVLIALIAGPALRADDAQDTALGYLKDGVTTENPRKRDVILLSLRSMKDAELAPYFRHLVSLKEDDPRAAHGLLGIVECGAAESIDLTRLAAISDDAIQFEVMREAISKDLISFDDARRALAMSSLSNRARVTAAIYLLEKKQSLPTEQLRQIANSADTTVAADADAEAKQEADKALHTKAMCWALLVQAGDQSAMGKLAELEESNAEKRDTIRTDIMATMIKHELDLLGPWALGICTEPETDPDLQMIALEAALRSGLAEAPREWAVRFNKAESLADKRRLALVALYSSAKSVPDLFDPMIAHDDEIIKQMGITGKAVASKANATEQVLKLVGSQYMLANIWTLNYAKEIADDEVARKILLGLILKSTDGEPDAQRATQAQRATTLLFTKYPKTAGPLLAAIIARDDMNDTTLRAIMRGLIESGEKGIAQAIKNVPEPEDKNAGQDVWIMIKAVENEPLNEDQLYEVQKIVRGAGNVPAAVRVRLGWAYLKIKGKHREAVAAAIKG